MTIGPGKSGGLMVTSIFGYNRVGDTLHSRFKRHYTLVYMKDGQWLYYDHQLKPRHSQPLIAKIIERSVTQHVVFVRQNKQ